MIIAGRLEGGLMRAAAGTWFAEHTHHYEQYHVQRLAALKSESGSSVSVVIPARNEQATVGSVVGPILTELVDRCGLVDELVVIDSDSQDSTAAVARRAGARVVHVRDIAPELGTFPGKGEALWKSLFVTTGDILVFIDADLTHWGTHFVTGLLGPLLASPKTLLVKGFYDRLVDGEPSGGEHVAQGGRVTELVARPLIAQTWPDLAAVVQPLAGEWAVRRSLIEQLRIPTGYGIEFAVLVDTYARAGLSAIAQVDLGARAHQHQNIHDLGVMAAEILAVARRRSDHAEPAETTLAQYARHPDAHWDERPIPTIERPAASSYRTIERPTNLPIREFTQ
jgi:glucosyl-3-phosphoglycerate synthase